MNDTMTLLILSVFDGVILVFGVYLLITGIKMEKTKLIGSLILTEDEVKKCEHKEAFAEFLAWREVLMGIVFVLFGVIRLLDKFVLKIGGLLDITLMIVLLVIALWFFKSLQVARAKYL